MITFHDALSNPTQLVGEYQVVKTPTALAERVLDSFPPEAWLGKDKKWLVPVSKSGIFELGIYKRLMKILAEVIPDAEARREHIVCEMIYSFAVTPACELFTKRFYLGKVWNDMRGFDTLKGNVQYQKFLHVLPDKDGVIMVKDKDGNKKYVKFNNIVGNPPYQDNSKANDPKNLYPDFVIKAITLRPDYLSMVIPARWMMGSGKGIQTFLDTMLASKHLSEIVEEKDSTKWFRDVSIKGGVMYFLYDAKHHSNTISINGIDSNFDGEDCIITDRFGLTIKSKVLSKSVNTFDKVMLGGCPFGIVSTHNEWSESIADSYVCHNSGKGDSAKVCFIRKSLVKRNTDCISKYKVCTSKGHGSGSDGISKPFVIGPDHIVSESYLVLCSFDSEQSAKNVETYLNTYLAQYLISLLKNTQNVSKRVFRYLPYLDFTRSYTDQDLYEMFNLSEEEIAHIENTTKDFPMFRGSKRNGKK